MTLLMQFNRYFNRFTGNMDSEEFYKLLTPSNIEIVPVDSGVMGDKEKLLTYLLSRCLQDTAMLAKEKAILDALLKRESLISTGMGLGVAIPHCSCSHVTDTLIYFAILKQGIDFQSIDERLVNIVALILFPEKKYERHVSLLACVAKLLNDAILRENVTKASTPAEVMQLLVNFNST